MTVIGHGEVDGTPDTLTTNAAVTFVAPDVTSAMNQTNERQQAVIDALVNAGVDRNDIATSNVSLQSQYGPDGITVVGYQASNAIDGHGPRPECGVPGARADHQHRRERDTDQLGDLSIHDDSQLVKDARARAFDDAEDRARQYADLSGLALGKVMSISEAPGTVPPAGADAARSGGRRRDGARTDRAGTADGGLRRDRGMGAGLTPGRADSAR